MIQNECVNESRDYENNNFPGFTIWHHDKYCCNKKHIDPKDEQLFIRFLEFLGVSKQVRLIKYELSQWQASHYKIVVPHYTRYIHFIETRPDGFNELFQSIKTKPENSIILWNYLITLCQSNPLKDLEKATCSYFYYYEHNESYVSAFSTMLKNEK